MLDAIQTEAEDPKLEDVKLPKDLKKALALQAEAHDLPSSTRSEQIIRQHRINKIGEHVFALSQGAEAPVHTAQNTKGVFDAQNRAAKEILIEQLGRQYPVVREMADELELLKTPKK